MFLHEESFGLVVNTWLFFPFGEGRDWFSEAEFSQCNFLSCPCPRAILWAWGYSGHNVSPQLCCSLKAPSSTGTTEAMGAAGTPGHRLMGCGKAGHPEAIPVPRLFIERERQQTQPMEQLLAYWGKNPGPLVLLFVNYLCCGTSRRPCPPWGPSIVVSFCSVTSHECSEVTRIQLYFQLCCLWLPAHAAPLQGISCPRGVQEDLIANRADLITQSTQLCGFKTWEKGAGSIVKIDSLKRFHNLMHLESVG